ncbi:hypothetical protein MHYP_G00114870 [Metynnis hypsauchen]
MKATAGMTPVLPGFWPDPHLNRGNMEGYSLKIIGHRAGGPARVLCEDFSEVSLAQPEQQQCRIKSSDGEVLSSELVVLIHAVCSSQTDIKLLAPGFSPFRFRANLTASSPERSGADGLICSGNV